MTSALHICMLVLIALDSADERVYPAATWETRAPEAVGLDPKALDAVAAFMGGRGCVVRHGYMVYTWGDAAKRGDVASAAKPWFVHFLFLAVEEQKLSGLDVKASRYAPSLASINAELDYKDRGITFRHLANQTSCYGVREKPGTAFDYNDWQMALFFDSLFLGVYGTPYADVDEQVLHRLLTDPLGCEDNPTLLSFGADHHPGRVSVSPRDFARFGWLYLNEGRWGGEQLLSRRYARMAVRSPLPASLPRTKGEQAEMCPDARTIGSGKIPDNQTDHNGSYSWLWWVNGVDRDGKRNWPSADKDVFAALGHRNGMRGMAVFPSLDLVISWNDTVIGDMPKDSNPLDQAFNLVQAAVREEKH
ncbi:MAG: serine hydrolase [FCB group bacterium]|nr:serine hydrolase [FCB group bacterium]